MILIDFNQIVIAAAFQFEDDLKRGSDTKVEDLLRHVALNSIASTIGKFRQDFGDNVVIACDNRKYWRREVFPFYKSSRKRHRERSPIDWDRVFVFLNTIKSEINDVFHYAVIDVEGAEADDVIGTLAIYKQNNELVQRGLDEVPESMLIVSADADHVQLQRYPNVKQWNPATKKWVVPYYNAERSLIEKICTGDAGDGIPNICSPDDVFVRECARQTPFRKTRIDDFVRLGEQACRNDVELHGWHRNVRLIDYRYIPADVQSRILQSYQSNKIRVRNDAMILEYLSKHRCRMLIDRIDEF